MTAPRTVAEKIWEAHALTRAMDRDSLIYVDMHLVHEASSAQAFDGLVRAGRQVRRPHLTLAVEDHNVPTDTIQITDPVSELQLETLRANCRAHNIELYGLGNPRQGIVHVTAPEQGCVLPGMTVVCGDSHTSTLGALGALAFGIGTTDVEQVLATQTASFDRPRTMAIEFLGTPSTWVTAKDLALAALANIGANGARGYAVEFRGPAVTEMSVEARMTLCNMSIEMGARAGIVAPDEVTYQYLEGRAHAPAGQQWKHAMRYWQTLTSDPGATFERVVTIDTTTLQPHVTWGTNPGQALPIGATVPNPSQLETLEQRSAAERALKYMGLEPDTALNSIPIDTVFIGSCTNGRLTDLQTAAAVLRGRVVAPGVRMLVVPGSMEVRAQAEALGLDQVFIQAGAQWRLPGCSMCPGMNPDRIAAPHRCVSTSNRNYENRQGPGARTHLASPATAAASAVLGRIGAASELLAAKVC
ncbi:3-isopropylmalate dehydratase large subunit [Mycobacterium sp. MUNTM1]